MKNIKIGERIIGEGNPPYVIAEFGMNSNGSIELAQRGIEEAAKAGADAIKFQTYEADDLVTKDAPRFWDFKEDDGKTQWEAYRDIPKLDWSWYPHLIDYCRKFNIEFLSTPFSFEAADKLNSLGMKAFKVASSDLSTLPYLKHIARFGKPIFLSTGASTMEEIHEAVDTIEGEGNDKIIILHCTLCYPTKPEDANFNLIKTLQKEFPNYPVGVSDHTLGDLGSIEAIEHGARVVEKHYTVDKTLGTNADHWLSVDPEELSRIVSFAKQQFPIEDHSSIYSGSSDKKIFECERETRKYDKRSIVAKRDIKYGEVITEEMIAYKRPGTGIWPKFYKLIIGHKAIKNIPQDTIINWNLISNAEQN